MEALDQEIKAFEAMKAELERGHLGEWALVYGDELIGTFDTFEEAGVVAGQRFGRGPYLIRQIGALPERLPSAAIRGPGTRCHTKKVAPHKAGPPNRGAPENT